VDNIVFVCPTLAIPGVDLAVRAAWLPFAPRLHVVNYPLWGTLDLESNYATARRKLLGLYARYGKLRLAGWSQGAPHSVRFALEHPHMVERLVLIAGALDGSWLGYLFPLLPAARDMTPGSAYCRTLARELAFRGHDLPYTVVLVGLEDGVIEQSAARLPSELDHLDQVHCHLFSNVPLRLQPESPRLHWHWAPGTNHVTMGFHPIVLWYIRAALTGAIYAPLPPHPEAVALFAR